LQYSIVGRRLKDALRRWKVLATTHRLLEVVRRIYETERQPETLREASGYLVDLTRGRYTRVWTPLGEHALLVDTADGRSLSVEALSRGTREQLFLSLRLALASSYARRGIHLPLVLDDLLVNFDADRAKAAATVLRDFAAAGHQLLILTCHEHIAKLFRSLKVDVRRLPENADADLVSRPIEELVTASVPEPEPMPEPAPIPAPKRRPAAAVKKPVQPEPEVVVEVALDPPPAVPPIVFEDDPDLYEDWPIVERQVAKVNPPEPVAVEPQPVPIPAPEPESDAYGVAEPHEYVELRGRTLWSGEGAEDFAGEFAERIVDRFTRYGWGEADAGEAKDSSDDDIGARKSAEPVVKKRSAEVKGTWREEQSARRAGVAKHEVIEDLDDLLDLADEAEAA
jgi:hypothetical protein